MRRIALIATAVAALGVGACQRGEGNNSSSVTINGAAVGPAIQNGLNDAGNMASDAGNVIGNTASRAGDVIENNAKAAWNEVKDAGRDILGEGNTTANASSNKTGR